MKKFLAIYTGSADGMAAWNALPEAELKKRQAEGIKAWHQWMETHKASIVEMGAPLGRTKSVSRNGIADVRNNMTGYTVVQAESHEAAAKLFEKHPHFMAFPGQAIEIMECMPIPTA
jgi:hypothetical protein